MGGEGACLEVLPGRRKHWKPQGTWSGQSLVRAEPFDVVELKLGVLWSP
jgi:hypothetical protein